MPTLHNRFPRVHESSVGVTSYSVCVHIALYKAAQVFNLFNKAGPDFDPIIKSKHESLIKAKQCNTDLGCELKDSSISNPGNTSFINQTGFHNNTLDPAYIDQIVSEDNLSLDSNDTNTDTGETLPVELEMNCTGFSFHTDCMPHIDCSLSIFLLIDVLLLFGLSKMPKCSLVETLSATLEYLQNIVRKWQDYIVLRNKEDKRAVNNDAHVPSPTNDYMEDKITGYFPYSPRHPDTGKFTLSPGRQGRAAIRDSTKKYTFEEYRSPSPVLPTFHEVPLRVNNIQNRSRPMSPKNGRAGKSLLHTVGIHGRQASYSPTRDKKTSNHYTPSTRQTTSYASHRSSNALRSAHYVSSPRRARSPSSPRHSTSDRAAH